MEEDMEAEEVVGMEEVGEVVDMEDMEEDMEEVVDLLEVGVGIGDMEVAGEVAGAMAGTPMIQSLYILRVRMIPTASEGSVRRMGYVSRSKVRVL
jgi:hypothetical protein